MCIFVLLALLLLFPTAAARAASGENSAGKGTAKIRRIIDTDAGADDLMASVFLLTRRDVEIEAVTVVNGLAHVDRGVSNVIRLLALGGKDHIPVDRGEKKPLPGNAAFTASWRFAADELPGIGLPKANRLPMRRRAVDYLAERFKSEGPALHILALGPLTNIAG